MDLQGQLVFRVNTLYKATPGARCCHNCEPDRFVAEEVVIEKKPGLRRGSKAMASEEFQLFATERLVLWREALLQKLYGDCFMVTGESIMSDETIQRLVAPKKRIRTEADLKAQIRWRFGGVHPGPGELGEHGKDLLRELTKVYAEYDAAQARERQRQQEEEEEEEEEEEAGNEEDSTVGKEPSTTRQRGRKAGLP